MLVMISVNTGCALTLHQSFFVHVIYIHLISIISDGNESLNNFIKIVSEKWGGIKIWNQVVWFQSAGSLLFIIMLFHLAL